MPLCRSTSNPRDLFKCWAIILIPDWREELSEDNPRWCKVWSGDITNYNIVKLNDYKKDKAYPYIMQSINGTIQTWTNAELVSDACAEILDKEALK